MIWWWHKYYVLRRRSGRVHNKLIAKSIITGFLNCIAARKACLQLAYSVYKRVWDDDYQTYFYWNQKGSKDATTSTWQRPLIFLNEQEPPLVGSIDASWWYWSGLVIRSGVKAPVYPDFVWLNTSTEVEITLYLKLFKTGDQEFSVALTRNYNTLNTNF